MGLWCGGVCLGWHRRLLRAAGYVMRHERKIEREGQNRIKLHSHEKKGGLALDRGGSELSESRGERKAFQLMDRLVGRE